MMSPALASIPSGRLLKIMPGSLVRSQSRVVQKSQGHLRMIARNQSVPRTQEFEANIPN